MRDAIEEPAARAGLALEPGLIELILKDIEDEPGGLPLLEHALYELWKRRDSYRACSSRGRPCMNCGNAAMGHA